MFKGIDVSAHQGRIDWAKVKNSGIQFAILRLGIGSNISSQDDAYFEANVQGCESVGLPWGAYLYSYALNLEDARSEVQHAVRVLKNKRPEYPVFLDMEDADGYKAKHGMPSNQGLVDICKTFLLGIEEDGINGNVDMNIAYTNYPEVIKKSGLNGFTAGASTDSSSTTPESGQGTRTYTVKKGNTLWDISKKYLGTGTRYPEIMSLNALKSTTIYPGQILRIPN